MFKIMTLPFDRIHKGFDDELLNKWLSNKKLKSYQAEFFQDGEEKYWTILMEYDPLLKKSSEKHEEGLDEPQKIFLGQLKVWRKERAEKDGVPVYIVGTNKEMADIVKTAPRSVEQLKNIKGFGKGKISKYGTEIIEMVTSFYEKS